MRRLTASEVSSIALILAIGAWLRFAGLTAGIPFDLGSDEPHVMERAVRILRTGDFNPHFFDYPGFYIYAQAAAAGLRFMVGAMDGVWRSLDDVSPADFYLTGRYLTAGFGILTIALVWRVGRRLGRLAGLAAALLLAVQPLHVRESHFVLTDVPMTCFVALTMLAAVRAVERQTARAWLLAGVAAGLSAGTKYTGGVAIVMPLVALLVAPMAIRVRAGMAVAIVVGAAAAFLLVAPYTVLDPPGFLNGFAALAAAHANGLEPSTPAWWTYIRHLQMNAGSAGLALCLASLVVAAVRTFTAASAASRAVWAGGLVFVVLFYLFIAGQTLVFARYLLPLLPPLFVLAGATATMVYRGVAAARGWGWRGGAAVGATLVMLLATTPVVRSAGWVRDRARPTTHQLAYEWILSHVPGGSHLAIETTMSLPSSYVVWHVRRLGDETPEEFAAFGVEYFVAAVPEDAGPLSGSARTRPYPDLLREMLLVAAFPPGNGRSGPSIQIYRRVAP